MLRLDMTLELMRQCKGCPTVLAKVRSQSQVDSISVPLKMGLLREGQSARGAFERLLLEMDCATMTLQVLLLGKRLVAVSTYELLLSKVHCTVVEHHVALAGELFDTGCNNTRYFSHRRGQLGLQLLDFNCTCA